MAKIKEKYDIIFNIGDRVKVTSLDLKGTINAIFISVNEVTYRVRFFYQCEVREIYFSHSELELIKEEEALGFKR